MKRSFRRDTIIFISLFVAGLVAVGALGAVLLGRSPSVFLRDKFTNPVWLFNCVFLIVIWVWRYPKLQRNHDRQTS
jgi:cyanate permease